MGVHIQPGGIEEYEVGGSVFDRAIDQGFEGAPVIQPDIVGELSRKDPVEEHLIHAKHPQPVKESEIELPVNSPHHDVAHSAGGEAQCGAALLFPGVAAGFQHGHHALLACFGADRFQEVPGKRVVERQDRAEHPDRAGRGREPVVDHGSDPPPPHDDAGFLQRAVSAADGHAADAEPFRRLQFGRKRGTGHIASFQNISYQLLPDLFGQLRHCFLLRGIQDELMSFPYNNRSKREIP